MRGFTLIEVLVALAIVGVALLAAVRASGTMAQTNAELRLRLGARQRDHHRARRHPGQGEVGARAADRQVRLAQK